MATSREPAECSQEGTPPSRLAVIFCVSGSLANIQKTLDCLQTQSAADRIDLLLTADSPALLEEAEASVRARGVLIEPRFLLHRATELAAARLMAAKEATAEIMTIAEDHSFPDANFAEELLAVFASCSTILAAGPDIHNPNPGSAVSRAQFLLTHGMLEPLPSVQRTQDVERLPWHNTTYRREAFLAAAHDVGFMQVESLLQEEIRRLFPRARFVHCHRTALRHVNMSRLVPAVDHAFHGGRIFGAEWATYHRWSSGSRLLHALAFPLVAVLRIVRCMPLLVDRRSIGRSLATSAAACLLAFVHAMGEAVGALWGKGMSPIEYTRYECDRGGFLTAGERHLLVSDSAEREAAGRQGNHADRPPA
ncbi:MAG: hypothetical protein ACKOTB_00925 [Planctomycetia bacterium]